MPNLNPATVLAHAFAIGLYSQGLDELCDPVPEEALPTLNEVMKGVNKVDVIENEDPFDLTDSESMTKAGSGADWQVFTSLGIVELHVAVPHSGRDTWARFTFAVDTAEIVWFDLK